MDINEISFITFTNYGFIDYVKNLILSLEKIQFSLPLKIYCIDQKSFDELEHFEGNILLEMLNDKTNTNESIVGWKQKGWNTMVFSKLKCIYKELLQNKYVLFTDSDIVYEKDCLQYLIDNIQNYDMMIQQNTRGFKYPLNTGFMFIKSNQSMKELFNWNTIDIESFTCDQDYINGNESKINYIVLPRYLFPIEVDYYNEWIKLTKFDPYIIHFNKSIGDNKKTQMVKLNKWALNSFYYQINNKFYYNKWNKPNYENLNKLLNYFKNDFKYNDMFQIYLTGRFNSNQMNETWDIDLLITLKIKNKKENKIIYECLYFLEDTALTKCNLLVDVKYIDNIRLGQLSVQSTNNGLYDYLKKYGDIIIYNNIIKKYSNYKLKDYSRDNNLLTALSNKLYKINIDKYNYTTFDKYKSYIQRGCIYYDNKLIFN